MRYSPDRTFHLQRLDSHDIAAIPDEIRAFHVVRNEIAGLAFLLSYYRRLGVDRFFFIENGSHDGTRDYLLAQQDCHVFTPSNSFAETNSGTDWLNFLLDHYGTGHWTLVADADELLIYPHCETIKLPAFCRYLSQQGSTALFVFMLDMYAQDLSTAICTPGTPFYDICPFFDSDYVFSPAVHELADGSRSLLHQNVKGGPRLRKFYPRQMRRGLFNRLLLKYSIKLAARTPLWGADKPHYSPVLMKIPLVKWHAGCKRLNAHDVATTASGKIDSVTGVLLHFKFFADFHEKALAAVTHGQYYKQSMEYRRYLAYVKKNPDLSFMYKGSRRFAGSNSILQEGLMRTHPTLDALARAAGLSRRAYIE